MALCALGKDIEDKSSTVYHARFKQAFKIALLGRTEIMIEYRNLSFCCLHGSQNFICLTTTHKEFGIGLGTATFYRPINRQPGTDDQLP